MSHKIAVKVRYGYSPSDFVIVTTPEEIARAMYARIEKIPVTLQGRFISGSEIKEIATDVHSYTGWYRSYEPHSADDFAQIERDVPRWVDTLVQRVAEQVNQAITTGEQTYLSPENLKTETLLEGTTTRETPVKLGQETRNVQN